MTDVVGKFIKELFKDNELNETFKKNTKDKANYVDLNLL
jgi:hypothetical protein